MIIERLGRRALKLFDRCGEKLCPKAQARGANLIFLGAVPITGPALRYDEIKRVTLPTRLAMDSLGSGPENEPPAGGAPAPAPEPRETVRAMAIGKAVVNCLNWASRVPSRIAATSLRALKAGLKAVFVGTVGGRISIPRTAAKWLGLATLSSVVPFVAVSGPVGVISLAVTGPLAALLYFAGRSKKAAPPVEPKRTFSFWRVENRIPARLRSLLYAAYGLDLFATGLVSSTRELLTKAAVPATGLFVLGLHLLTRRAVRKALAKRDQITPEPQRKPRRHQTPEPPVASGQTA